MADAQNPIPFPQSGDSDDVELALETAQRLYKTGDHVEALKWLRRAANAADEAGDDRRQLELARAAADFTAFALAATSVVATGTESSASTSPTKAASDSHIPTAAHSPSRMPQPQKPPPPPSARLSTAPASPVQTTSLLPGKPVTSGGPPPLKNRPASVAPGPAASYCDGKTKNVGVANPARAESGFCSVANTWAWPCKPESRASTRGRRKSASANRVESAIRKTPSDWFVVRRSGKGETAVIGSTERVS